ncbi:MAG TPA: hypothetical protein VMF06_15125 [Candidatus Limnocylindria bacterium]|jgi:hypothetical protein|nr:hypothetical protein [Candidatus Limnocylindria bacterium]
MESKPLPKTGRVPWLLTSTAASVVAAAIHLLAGGGWLGGVVESAVSMLALSTLIVALFKSLRAAWSGRFPRHHLWTLVGAVSLQILLWTREDDLFLWAYARTTHRYLMEIETPLRQLMAETPNFPGNSEYAERRRILGPLLAPVRQFSGWRGFVLEEGCHPGQTNYLVWSQGWSRRWGSVFGCPEAFGQQLKDMKVKELDAGHFIFVGPFRD